ncbi:MULTISPECIES: hypothetical protein [unclassified Bradyrhizobium]|uniref:hypothetical protein n=1 Tax=unclassified Bradyrhizobium TaxID=2631580 RepID=UPI0028E7B7D0|nr:MULTISPECIES: hypothetical protein [unclassified Bradyrhizobium]
MSRVVNLISKIESVHRRDDGLPEVEKNPSKLANEWGPSLCDELGTALIEDIETDGGGGALNAVLKSLNKMRLAKSRFGRPSSGRSPQSALRSQIELCDALLEEIQSISSSLGKRAKKSAAPRRRPMATRRRRGTAHLIAPQPAVPGRTRQQK